VPTSFMGRVLWEALNEADEGASRPLPDVSQVRQRNEPNEALVESRLRALGYIE
jgi:hypothetical protein